jgi:hypothetical protein
MGCDWWVRGPIRTILKTEVVRGMAENIASLRVIRESGPHHRTPRVNYSLEARRDRTAIYIALNRIVALLSIDEIYHRINLFSIRRVRNVIPTTAPPRLSKVC